MKRFNWGWGIAAVYIGFAVFMLTLAISTRKANVELVTGDYYSQELRYQEMIDKKKRANMLSDKPQWLIANDAVNVKFADVKAEGTIMFYKPSSASGDLQLPIELSESGEMVVPVSLLSSGSYKIQLDWQQGGEAYYTEGVIYIN
jgi:hypothetical protein